MLATGTRGKICFVRIVIISTQASIHQPNLNNIECYISQGREWMNLTFCTILCDSLLAYDSITHIPCTKLICSEQNTQSVEHRVNHTNASCLCFGERQAIQKTTSEGSWSDPAAPAQNLPSSGAFALIRYQSQSQIGPGCNSQRKGPFI